MTPRFRLRHQKQRKRYNAQGSTTGLAVIGVGKLGGRELSYGSDLDILFVFSESRAAAPPTGLTVFEYFSKVAEKTISYLSTLTREGFVFRVDTRLRPTGSKGPLVQSIDAFKNYYSSQAETWELQALLRARCVAGDRAVGERVLPRYPGADVSGSRTGQHWPMTSSRCAKGWRKRSAGKARLATISNRAQGGLWTSSSLSSICSYSTGSGTNGCGSLERIMPCGP